MSRDYPEYNEALAVRKEQVIEQRQKDLDRLHPNYLAAKAAVDGRQDGPELVILSRMLQTYRPGDPGEKAIYIVAQATMLIEKLVAPFAVVSNYEVRETELSNLKKSK